MLPDLYLLFALVFSAATPAGTATPDCGSQTFHFSPLARDAYQQVFRLRFDETRATLADLKRREPDNLIALLVENYLDVFTVMVDDDRAAYSRLAKNMEPRLARLARGDRKSPWFLYTQAEIRLQWAILRGKYGDYMSSLSDFKQAYALLEQNRREHPGFTANLKSLGVLHALIGNIPDEYRWAVKALGGMSGTIEQGMQELHTALEYARQHDFVFEDEARVACAFLLLHVENKKTQAWEMLNAGKLDPHTSPVAAFVMASIAMRTGRNDEAIRLLEASPDGAGYHPFPYRFFLLGIAKLNRLDPDAYQPLQTFVKTFKGESGIKEAYQKLAWHQLVMGNPDGYHSYMRYVKKEGNDRSEPDKAALREAERGELPDKCLTQARLLFDGGHFQCAYDVLKNNGAGYSPASKFALEYHYRLGRIFHEMGKTDDAIRLYTQTLDQGSSTSPYFACNAALQLGILLEQHGAVAKAKTAYRRCLLLQPDEYAASLHAKAKAGLNRLGG
jgi:tetratricopeptide (TPR) repeat protein